jgi:hypothetical protein
MDIKPFMETVLWWGDGNELLANKIFIANAEQLWNVKRTKELDTR